MASCGVAAGRPASTTGRSRPRTRGASVQVSMLRYPCRLLPIAKSLLSPRRARQTCATTCSSCSTHGPERRVQRRAGDHSSGHVVHHDAEAALDVPVDPADRAGLPDVEKPEQGKTQRHHVTCGAMNIVIQKPTNSSKTMPPWSCTRRSRETVSQIHTPRANAARTVTAYNHAGRWPIARKMGIATSVPKVPGAKFASPLPKPNASKCRQLPNTRLLMERSNIALAGRPGRRAGQAVATRGCCAAPGSNDSSAARKPDRSASVRSPMTLSWKYRGDSGGFAP